MFTEYELDCLADLQDRVERGDYAEDRGLPRRVSWRQFIGYAVAYLMLALVIGAIVTIGAFAVMLSFAP